MYEIVKYSELYEKKWDKFVLEKSVNGTFLQSRRFLNYHAPGKFTDSSVLIMQGSEIVAAIPACVVDDQGKRCFMSHAGSTFGGIVINKVKYNILSMEEIFICLEKYLRDANYDRAILKCTSDIFSSKSNDLLDYFFYKYGWKVQDELSFYVDCTKISDDIISSFSADKRRGYRCALNYHMNFRKLEHNVQIENFYTILCDSLKKHHVRPVHTLDELLELKNHRINSNMDFFGCYLEDMLIAGAMVFYFDKYVFHTQYLAMDAEYAKFYPMNFLNYNLIKTAKEKEFDVFSFGISTEEHGKILNTSLAQFKEGFGCDYCVNRTYVKDFET